MPVPKILVVTDIGNDYDDIMALLILGYFHKAKKIQVKGVIVTLEPVIERARLADGLFKGCMGIDDIEVACGTRGTDERRATKEWDRAALDASFLSPKRNFVSYLDLSRRLFTEAAQNKDPLRLLAIASLRDVWAIANQDVALFSKAVSEIHIQGGCELKEEGKKKVLVPRKDASNNTDDMAAAGKIYKLVQDGNIGCVVYNKEAAFVSSFGKDVFDPARASPGMKEVASYVHRIHDVQKKYFYSNAIKPANERHREYMDRNWFIQYNTKDLPASLQDRSCTADEILPYTFVTPYDPIAALGCIHGVAGAPNIARVPIAGLEGKQNILSVGANLTEAEGGDLAVSMRNYLRLALRTQ